MKLFKKNGIVFFILVVGLISCNKAKTKETKVIVETPSVKIQEVVEDRKSTRLNSSH